MSINNSANMLLPVPVVGQESGPQWATDINNCLTIVDAHDHSPGYGVQITPSGININGPLPFNSNSATTLLSTQFISQMSGVTTASSLYVLTGDLYYNNGSGTPVQVTIGGSIAGATGSISGLVSPASASYVSGSSTFVWQSNALTPANMDCANVVLRNLSASSNGLTLEAPAALAVSYSLVLPPLPIGATKLMTLDVSGNMAAITSIDGTTLVKTSNVIGVGANSIGTTQLSAAVLETVVPSGVISIYGGVAAPTGYLLCDGTSYLRASYPALFTAIGTANGAADGSHFNVPDLRGRFLRGIDGSAGRDPDSASRTAMNAGGNVGNNIGSVESDSFKAHTHSVTTSALTAGNAPDGLSPFYYSELYGNSTTDTTVTISTANSTGGNETRPINAYVNYIIKT